MRLAAWTVAAAIGWAAPAAASDVVTWAVDPATTGALVEDHRQPLVTLQIEWPVGTWSPWARRNDLRDAFEIQVHDRAGRLRRRADALAVDLKLGVGPRATWLRLECLPRDLDAAASLVRDVLGGDDFDRGELVRRRRERRLDWSTNARLPGFVAARAAAETLFRPDDPRLDPWRRPPRGSTDVAALAHTRDVLVRVPGRTIAIAGDLDPARAREVAVSLLPPAAAAPAGSVPELPALAPSSEREVDVDVPLRRATQVWFAWGRASPAYGDADYPAFRVADHVLGGHFYSRLYVALRHHGGETYGTWTSNTGDADPGVYALMTFTRADNAAHAERTLRDVLAELHRDGIDREELDGAIGFLRGRRAFRRQSPADVLDTWLDERRQGLPEGFFDDLAERAAALDLDEVNAYIRRFFDPAEFSMVRVRPE